MIECLSFVCCDAGENVARGALLGALLGAQHGMSAFPAWTHELKNHDAVLAEIDQLVALSVGTNEGTATMSAQDL